MSGPDGRDRTACLPTFGFLLRQRRVERGWSLRELGSRITFNRGYIGKVEQGERFPDRKFAELADRILDGHGELVGAWQAEADERRRMEHLGRLLTASVKDSLQLISSTDESVGLDAIEPGVADLAARYPHTPPGPMLQDAVALRSEVLRRLRSQDHHPAQRSDLNLALGRIQGVLAYAALDLGDAEAAMIHARAASVCAERVGDAALRAWVRGTQSLIARFQGEYGQALELVHDGLRHPAPGTARIRLMAGVAQCHANLDDSTGANDALNLAQRERDQRSSPDPIGGLFGFSQAKQHYYARSSLIWLDGRSNAERAAQEAATAIRIWEQGPPEDRSLDDDALAHVYLATAQLQLLDLDAASAAIAPVVRLPTDRQISWIKKRLDRFATMLRTAPYHGSHAASDLYDEIRSLHPST